MLKEVESLAIDVRKLVAMKSAEVEPRPDRKHRRRRLRKQLWRKMQPFRKFRCWLEKAIEDATRRKQDLLARLKKTVKEEKSLVEKEKKEDKSLVEKEKTYEQACNTTYAR
jgi:hypothetical protein